ncbi:hypothetical protein LJC33_07445, partial [Eubacteriales bacterium OttesenSCG-928-N13]|nr:hypothetical protein [Eubacteriales bacterium OttesenSCG-928-N13]
MSKSKIISYVAWGVQAILVIAILATGISMATYGMYGQNIYNEATDMLGCKKPDTMGFVMAPETITEVAYGQNPDELKRFLTETLGLPADRVDGVVDARTLYTEKQAESMNYDAFLAYAQAQNPELTEDEFREMVKDRTVSDPMRAEMLKSSVMAELGLDDNGYTALESDSDMIALFQEGLPNLTKEGYTGDAFMQSVPYLFVGLALTIVGLACIAIWLIGRSRRGKTRAINPKAQKVTDFLLKYALYIIMLAILVVVSIMKPNFIDMTNLLNILKQASTKGILALGCAGLIVLAGTDLSIGRTLGLSAAVTASLVQATTYASRMFPQITTDLPLWIPLFASIAVAVTISLINGFGVSKLHLHAFIITLGTQLIAQGTTAIYIESQPSGTAQALSTFNRNFLDKAAGNLVMGDLKIPLVILYFLGLAVIMWFVWNKTKLGKNMFAVGGNEEAAAVSGVNVARTIMLVYLMAGVLYGISAFLEAARITSVGANTGL